MIDLKKEQKEIMKLYQKKKIPYSIIIRQLIAMATISLIAMINPINLKDNLEVSLAILGISTVLIIINYVFIVIAFKNEKYKLLNFLYITLNILFGLMLKFVFYKLNINQFFICTVIVSLYLTVLSIIAMQIKKLAIPAFIMEIVIFYLVFKYANLTNVFVFIFISNSFTYFLNLKGIMTKINDNNYGKDDIIMSQSVLTFLFIAQICCFITLIKL